MLAAGIFVLITGLVLLVGGVVAYVKEYLSGGVVLICCIWGFLLCPTAIIEIIIPSQATEAELGITSEQVTVTVPIEVIVPETYIFKESKGWPSVIGSVMVRDNEIVAFWINEEYYLGNVEHK